MTANEKQHKEMLEYCRNLLPNEMESRIVNLVYIILAMLSSMDSHLSSLSEVIPLLASDLSIEQRITLAFYFTIGHHLISLSSFGGQYTRK